MHIKPIILKVALPWNYSFGQYFVRFVSFYGALKGKQEQKATKSHSKQSHYFIYFIM